MSTRFARERCVINFFLTIVVALAFATTAQARHIRPKTTTPPSKPHSVPNPDHDVLTSIDEYEKGVQKQLMIEAAANDHNANALNRSIGRLSDQLQLHLSEQARADENEHQLLLLVQSTRRLLRFIVALFVLFCGAVIFFGLRLIDLRDLPFGHKRPVGNYRIAEPRADARWTAGS